MTTAVTQTTNIVPVQGVFAPEPTFALQYFVGPAGTPFYAPLDPNIDGATITNSTINSTTIGATSPSTGIFTNISTTTGTISTTPAGDTDIANKGYVDSVAQGLDVKASCVYSTTANITLSGLGTQAGGDWASSLTVGDRVLVKNQTLSQFNGIYVAASSTWARSTDMNVWAEVPSAFTFIESGTTLADTGWVTTANAGGTIDVTAMPWSQFSGAGSYLAGTGLTLTGNTFSVTNTAVTAAAYGSASSVGTFTVNAQGQLTLAASTSIAIAGTQITSGTIDSARLSGSYSGITGLGTLGNLTVTNTITGSVSGNAATATSATNIAGGTVGAVVYQSGSGATAFLSAGTNGQVLTLAAGLPSWATPTVGTVTSIAQTFTGGIISVTGSPITTNGTLALTVAGTSGGIPYFASGTTWATSALLAANALMTGGGAGVAPKTVTTGTGVVTALGVNTGTAGAFVVNGGALGTPSSGTVTNLTGTASININGTVGATTAAAGKFTTIDFSSTLAVSGVTGTSGQVLTSAGASAPTWTTPTAYATVTDDTTTATVRYPLFANQTTGNLSTEFVSSTKLQYTPSTGTLATTVFSGSGASLTSLPAGQLSGTIPSGVLGNSSLFIGTTTIALNRSSASQSLTGVNIDGSAGSATTATTATNATNTAITDDTTTITAVYPTWVTTTTGNLPQKTSSTKLSFIPSTGVLTATGFAGAGTGLTGTASSLNIGGNAATATSAATLTTGRTLAITGDLAYTSPSFNGSANVTAAGTLATVNTNVGSFTNATLTVNGKGLITAASNGTAPVTSVTATSPVASTGGATPVISMPAATALVSGYLTSTDWATFNSKESGTVTSVGQTFTGGIISVAGSPVTTSGTLALTVAGTSGGIPYFTSATGWATSAALAANAIVLGGGAGAAPATTTTGTGVVTALGVNTGTAGAFVVNGGALGTPSGGTVTNLTGTASININGTVGATTANTGAFTTVSATGVITSTVLTGTAPLTVASTTQVANLNAATSGTATNATNVAITDDTTTAAEMYLSWVTATTGNLPIKVSSTKLKFNPSTGVLTATGGVTGGAF